MAIAVQLVLLSAQTYLIPGELVLEPDPSELHSMGPSTHYIQDTAALPIVFYKIASDNVQYQKEKGSNQLIEKRSSGCLGRCLRMQMLHPAQCNTLC
eukprot:TRINITY_DN74803_c0_g1_i1.p1 TRINITY_DN74803_c0_g1~~TRINITY_DN74803_c0_g1_i1.p1  ORF type:complete len:113 (-),score=14.28 TRINITY_DN74803_c0_g1_i1:20-310(-)